MNKYGYKEIRILNSENLRMLCINKNWCTKCNNSQYQYILNLCITNNVDTDTIFSLAANIKEYSDTEQEIQSVMFDIAKICNTFFENE